MDKLFSKSSVKPLSLINQQYIWQNQEQLKNYSTSENYLLLYQYIDNYINTLNQAIQNFSIYIVQQSARIQAKVLAAYLGNIWQNLRKVDEKTGELKTLLYFIERNQQYNDLEDIYGDDNDEYNIDEEEHDENLKSLLDEGIYILKDTEKWKQIMFERLWSDIYKCQSSKLL